MKFDATIGPEVISYYYTNYSTCPPDTSFFATWQFVSIFLHSVLILESPLAIFTGYCIVKKTPKAMGSLKWAMLNLHIWSTYMDVLICSLITPYLMFPAIGGFTVGLLRWLEVPTTIQAYLGITSVGFMFNSISALFENRSSSFQKNWFRFERSSTRFAFFTFNGLITAVCLLPVFSNLPDQGLAKIYQLTHLPCPNEEYFFSPVLILINTYWWAFYFAIVLCLQWFWIFFSILFFIACTTYFVFYSENANFSQNTKKLQKTFFIGNLIQIAIPSVFWATPTYALVYLVMFSVYSQSLNNIGVAFVSLHGLASILAILFIHKPYREFTLSILCRNKKVVSLPASLVNAN